MIINKQNANAHVNPLLLLSKLSCYANTKDASYAEEQRPLPWCPVGAHSQSARFRQWIVLVHARSLSQSGQLLRLDARQVLCQSPAHRLEPVELAYGYPL